MALWWDVSGIKDKSILWYTAKEDDKANGIVKGEQYMTGYANGWIWFMMNLDISSITEKNWKEVYWRVKYYERLNGQYFARRVIEPKHVKQMIGLKTNVSNCTRKQFIKRWAAHFEKDTDSIVKQRLEAEIAFLAESAPEEAA